MVLRRLQSHEVACRSLP